MREIRSSRLAGLAGVLTIGAGMVHAAAAGTHGGDDSLVRLFAVTAVLQVMAGALLAARPSRSAAVAVFGLNGAAAGAWLLSRTIGIGFIASLSAPEAAGLQDVTVTAMEVGAALAVVASFRLRSGLGRPMTAVALSPMWVLALAPTLVGMTAPHTHGASHQHDHATEAVAGDGHAHAAGAGAGVSLAADPIFDGADTSHANEDELRVAADLILRTRQTLREQFPTKESVVAAGYTWIGDGLLLSQYQHFIHSGYLNDGRELDPEHIESIVIESTPTGQRVASAMYILETGHTMADVPTGAGALTAWHDHQNICWDESGTRIAGFLRDGRCTPGGTFRITPPMLHVWLRDHACGPFAGIEGHGGLGTSATGCTHAHAAS